MDHRTIQLELPGYLRGDVDASTRASVEHHLESCSECAAFVRTLGPIAAAMTSAGTALLDEHPSASRLRGHAVGETEDPDGEVERHLETCGTCSAEVDVWRREGADHPFGVGTSTPTAVPARDDRADREARLIRFRRYRWAGGSLAAGLILGVGLSGFLRDPALEPPVPTTPTTAVETTVETPTPSPEPVAAAPEPAWSGRVPVRYLEPPTRSDAATIEIVLAPGQPYAILSVVADVPSDTPGDAACRFEVLDADGTARWSTTMAADEVLDAIADEGLVTFLVPAEDLPRGRVVLRQTAGERTALEVPFRITATD